MHIWIIELLSHKGRWEPTVGAHLTLAEAKNEMKNDWQFNFPNNKFRIKKYNQA